MNVEKWIYIYIYIYRAMIPFVRFWKKKKIDKNRAHNDGSIKNPMNPERKTKFYTPKKMFFSYMAYIVKHRQSKSKNHQLLAHKWNKPRK